MYDSGKLRFTRRAVFNVNAKVRKPYMRREVSGRRDSNSRLTAWKAVALPTELLPRLGNDLAKSSKMQQDSKRCEPLTALIANFCDQEYRENVGADGFEPPKV